MPPKTKCTLIECGYGLLASNCKTSALIIKIVAWLVMYGCLHTSFIMSFKVVASSVGTLWERAANTTSAWWDEVMEFNTSLSHRPSAHPRGYTVMQRKARNSSQSDRYASSNKEHHT